MRTVAIVAAAAAVVTALASVFATRLSAPTEVARGVRKLQIVVAGEDSLGAATNPSISPDGSHNAYNCGGFAWIRSFDDLAPRRIAESSIDVTFWSPDGAFLDTRRSTSCGRSRWRAASPRLFESPANIKGGGASWERAKDRVRPAAAAPTKWRPRV
jgi:hypothetical protein